MDRNKLLDQKSLAAQESGNMIILKYFMGKKYSETCEVRIKSSYNYNKSTNKLENFIQKSKKHLNLKEIIGTALIPF